jgi:TRAP transporter TAXI family solute receptor
LSKKEDGKMKTDKWRPLVFAVSPGLAVVFSSSPAQAGTAAPKAPWQTKEYHFAGWPSTAGQYLWGAITWSLISRDTGLRVTVLESSGTEEDMQLVQNKKADMGHIDTTLVKRTFGDKHDLRKMFMHAPGVWQFAVAKDANIKSLKDLNGKKWNPGPAGGGSTQLTMQIIEMFGIKPNYHHATLTDAAEAYVDRQIVGFSYRGAGREPTSAMVEANSARPLIFISLTDEEIARILQRWPDLTKFQVRANLYVGQTEPVNTIADVGTVEAAHKDMPAEAAYEFTKSYWKNFTVICQQYPSVCATSPEASLTAGTIPLHVGAMKYYQEIGLKIPESAVPPEAKK